MGDIGGAGVRSESRGEPYRTSKKPAISAVVTQDLAALRIPAETPAHSAAADRIERMAVAVLRARR